MYLALGLSSLFLIGLDQWVKHWASVTLSSNVSRTFIPGLLDLTYVENNGIAFGMLSGGRWFFVALTILLMAFISVYCIRLPRDKKHLWIRIPLTLVFSGAAGNMIDRIAHGYVVDMFEPTFINFAVFNVADSCIVTGAITLILAMLFKN